MSLAATAPISEVFQSEVTKTGPALSTPLASSPFKTMPAKTDFAFERLIASLSNALPVRDNREALTGFHALEAMLGRSMNATDATQQVIQHPTLRTDLSMNAPAQNTAPKTDNTREMTAALAAAVPLWKPIEKLKTDAPIGETKANRDSGVQKGNDAKEKMAQMKDNMASMVPGGPQPAAKGPIRTHEQPAAASILNGVVGSLAVSAGLGMINPALGAAHTMAALVNFLAPSTAPEGRGSFGVQNSGEFSRAPVSRNTREQSAFVAEAAPSANNIAAAPIRAANLGDVGPRANLAGATLTGISKIELDRKVEDSAEFKTAQAQLQDSKQVAQIHLKLQDNGFEKDGQSLIPKDLVPVVMQNPRLAAPALRA